MENNEDVPPPPPPAPPPPPPPPPPASNAGKLKLTGPAKPIGDDDWYDDDEDEWEYEDEDESEEEDDEQSLLRSIPWWAWVAGGLMGLLLLAGSLTLLFGGRNDGDGGVAGQPATSDASGLNFVEKLGQEEAMIAAKRVQRNGGQFEDGVVSPAKFDPWSVNRDLVVLKALQQDRVSKQQYLRVKPGLAVSIDWGDGRPEYILLTHKGAHAISKVVDTQDVQMEDVRFKWVSFADPFPASGWTYDTGFKTGKPVVFEEADTRRRYAFELQGADDDDDGQFGEVNLDSATRKPVMQPSGKRCGFLVDANDNSTRILAPAPPNDLSIPAAPDIPSFDASYPVHAEWLAKSPDAKGRRVVPMDTKVLDWGEHDGPERRSTVVKNSPPERFPLMPGAAHVLADRIWTRTYSAGASYYEKNYPHAWTSPQKSRWQFRDDGVGSAAATGVRATVPKVGETIYAQEEERVDAGEMLGPAWLIPDGEKAYLVMHRERTGENALYYDSRGVLWGQNIPVTFEGGRPRFTEFGNHSNMGPSYVLVFVKHVGTTKEFQAPPISLEDAKK